MGLPRPLLDSLVPQFFQQRKLLLMSEVDIQAQESLTQAILALNMINQEPITLYIDSGGGNVWLGRYIADAIRCSAAPVNGIVVGGAHSTAFWVLQNCHKRAAYPNARMMFHGYTTHGVRCDQSDFQNVVAQSVSMHEDHMQAIALRSGQTLEQWRLWSASEHYFTGADAVSLGILDEIVEAKPLPGMVTVVLP